MGTMESIGNFVANPFGLGDAGAGAVNYLADSLGLSNTKQVQAGMASLDELMDQARSVGSQNRQIYGNYINQMQGMYGDNAGKYNDVVDQLSKAIGEGYDTFGYTKSVDEFLDPARNQRVEQAMTALNKSAAAGGNRWSSDFMNNMAAKQQALASDEWEKAYNKMMQDRQQQLQEWNAGQSSKQNYLGNLGTLAGLYGSDRNQLANAYGDYYSNLASQNNADLQMQSDLTQAKTNLAMQEQSGASAVAGLAGSILGAIFG